MTKYHGYVGYAVDVQAYPGVWEEQITEHEYFGDVIKNRMNIQQTATVNAGISISNSISISISIVGDPFAYDNFYAIRYVTYLGKKWTVTGIEINRPRLILTLGGLYNG